jgi:hypothetical protein
MLFMPRRHLLLITAIVEAATGLSLLAWPSIPLALLLGVDRTSPETLVVARIAGAALLAVGVGCWLGRPDAHGASQLGLLAGVLTYDMGAAVILAYAGLFVGLVGVALWPAVLLHAALAVWCLGCIWNKPRGDGARTREDLKAVKKQIDDMIKGHHGD